MPGTVQGVSNKTNSSDTHNHPVTQVQFLLHTPDETTEAWRGSAPARATQLISSVGQSWAPAIWPRSHDFRLTVYLLCAGLANLPGPTQAPSPLPSLALSTPCQAGGNDRQGGERPRPALEELVIQPEERWARGKFASTGKAEGSPILCRETRETRLRHYYCHRSLLPRTAPSWASPSCLPEQPRPELRASSPKKAGITEPRLAPEEAAPGPGSGPPTTPPHPPTTGPTPPSSNATDTDHLSEGNLGVDKWEDGHGHQPE